MPCQKVYIDFNKALYMLKLYSWSFLIFIMCICNMNLLLWLSPPPPHSLNFSSFLLPPGSTIKSSLWPSKPFITWPLPTFPYSYSNSCTVQTQYTLCFLTDWPPCLKDFPSSPLPPGFLQVSTIRSHLLQRMSFLILGPSLWVHP